MSIEFNGILLFTIDEIAEKLQVNTMTIRRYIQAGKMKARKIKGKWHISETHFTEFLTGADEIKDKN